MPGSWRTDAWLCATTDTALSSSHCCRALAYSWLRGGSHANSENCLLRLRHTQRERLAPRCRSLGPPCTLSAACNSPLMRAAKGKHTEKPVCALADLAQRAGWRLGAPGNGLNGGGSGSRESL